MLYLVDRPLADVAFRTAAGDPDPVIVLLQDGVVLLPEGAIPPELTREVFAVESDLAVRGIEPPDNVDPIGYDTLIELVLEYEVKSFV